MIKNCTYKLLLLFLLFAPTAVEAQHTHLYRQVDSLSRYIASEHFKALYSNQDHISLLDSIYLRALEICNQDISEALLTVTFTAIPVKKIPLVLPLIKAGVEIPLPSAEGALFTNKNDNLPSRLFFDSPKNEFGDKDKIAHFFGNSFLKYNELIFDFTKFIGIFVEEFEEKFKVQSSVDPRDLHTNQLGIWYGKLLKSDGTLLPSRIFYFELIKNFRY